MGTSWFLTRKLGYNGAFNFFISGQHITANDALKLGIISKIVKHDQLMEEAHKWAFDALKLPPHTLEMTKTMLRSIVDIPFEASLRMEEFAEANCFSTRALPLAADGILKRSKI